MQSVVNDIENFRKFSQSMSPITECVLYCWKIDLLWFVFVRLTNVGAHKFVQPFLTTQILFTVLSQSFPETDIFFIKLFWSWREASWDCARFPRQCKCLHQKLVLQIFSICMKILPRISSEKDPSTFSPSAYNREELSKLFALAFFGCLKREISSYCKKYISIFLLYF